MSHSPRAARASTIPPAHYPTTSKLHAQRRNKPQCPQYTSLAPGLKIWVCSNPPQTTNLSTGRTTSKSQPPKQISYLPNPNILLLPTMSVFLSCKSDRVWMTSAMMSRLISVSSGPLSQPLSRSRMILASTPVSQINIDDDSCCIAVGAWE